MNSHNSPAPSSVPVPNLQLACDPLRNKSVPLITAKDSCAFSNQTPHHNFHPSAKTSLSSSSSNCQILPSFFLLSSNQHISNRMRHVRWCIRIGNSNIKQCLDLWEPYTSYPQISNQSRNSITTLLHNRLKNFISVCQSCQISQSISYFIVALSNQANSPLHVIKLKSEPQPSHKEDIISQGLQYHSDKVS